MFYDLYLIKDYINLLYQNNEGCKCVELDNRNMNLKNVKLHKGVDQVVRFKVFDTDRRVVSIDPMRVIATLIDNNSRERVLVKEAYCTSTKGVIELQVTEGDLMNISTGYYTMSIVAQEYSIPEVEQYTVSTPFYTNAAGDINLNVEVFDSVDKTPVPTIEIADSNWNLIIEGVDNHAVYYTGPYMANLLKNYTSGLHTIALQTNDYSGKFEVLGSLESTPSLNAVDYFAVNFANGEDNVVFDHYTGIVSYTFNANIMWLMFKHTPDALLLPEDQGNIAKVQLRS